MSRAHRTLCRDPEHFLTIEIPRDSDEYAYKYWHCKHGQEYVYNFENEKWKALRLVRNGAYWGCGCSVPCSPNENRAVAVLERHMAEICQDIGLCECGHNTATLIHSNRPGSVVIQCDSCGVPRSIDTVKIWNRIDHARKIREERELDDKLAETNWKLEKEKLRIDKDWLAYHVHNRQELINEVIKQEEKRIDAKVKELQTSIKGHQEKLKKIYQVLKNGKQSRIKP